VADAGCIRPKGLGDQLLESGSGLGKGGEGQVSEGEERERQDEAGTGLSSMNGVVFTA
jgi:hypothetical protein